MILPRRYVLIALGMLVVSLIAAQFYARMGAVNFGGSLAGALMEVGTESFRDTPQLIQFLESPEMTVPAEQARKWDLLHLGYSKRIEALKRGVIYCSEEANRPEKERFSHPPDLSPLAWRMSELNDEENAQTCLNLIMDYRLGL